MKIILTFTFICLTVISVMAQDIQSDSIRIKELNEVIVEASYLTREVDHILAVPTKEQRKHAMSGYDLLRNLMIPGISVNRNSGTVNTPAGTATICIDGREVDFREVQSLRPRDIASVEYYDLPSGKYAKDAPAINFILKRQTNGGYTQIDAMQGLGYLNGNYNMISKYITGTKSLNLWAGYSVENPKSTATEQEIFGFEDRLLKRESSYNEADNKASEEYVQASISNRGKRYIWMLRGGMSWKDNRNDSGDGSVGYWLSDAEMTNEGFLRIDSRNKTLRPSLYFYGLHTISDTKSLDYVLDGYYSRNDYERAYDSGSSPYVSNVKENYWYAKANANYSMTLSKDLIDCQINRKTFWQYQLTAMWNHGNWAIEANANNLFLMRNRIREEFTTAFYSLERTNLNRKNNQYATLKVVYSFDYGKKTSKPPKYQHIESESAILK